MAKKLALGKGIASLIQETPQAVMNSAAETVLRENNTSAGNTLLVDINQINTNPNQPRKIFKEKELFELANSIKENGIIQPLVVAKTETGFELIAGERRLRASKLAELEKVPVVLKRGTDKDKMVMAIIENVQRSDLNCVEEALAYYQLMEEYKLTQEEVAKKLGKERSSVANYLRILKLTRPVVEMLQQESLSFGHAKILASIKDPEEAERLANKAAIDGMSVRELEGFVKKNESTPRKKASSNPFFDERVDLLRQKLEQKTGFHLKIASKKNGSGQINIKFNNEDEFNDLYEYLMN